MTNPIYGGTPQNISQEDILKHLEVSEFNISHYIKDNSSSGLGILDFEEWRPLYAVNSLKKEVYKQAAIKLIKAEHGNFSEELVNKTAVEEYNKKARAFLEQSLVDAKRLRNWTRWGLYGFPYCNYNAGTNGTSDTTCSKQYQDFNNRMMYIYEASQALYPSIYLNNRTTPDRNFRYVQAILKEAHRIARNFSSPLPIYVYTKFEYDPLKKPCDFYEPKDLCTTVVLPYVMGVDGLIFWSSSTNIQYRCDIITTFLNTTLGHLYQDLLGGRLGNRTGYNETKEWNFKDICEPYIEKITEYVKVFNSTTKQQCQNATTIIAQLSKS